MIVKARRPSPNDKRRSDPKDPPAPQRLLCYCSATALLLLQRLLTPKTADPKDCPFKALEEGCFMTCLIYMSRDTGPQTAESGNHVVRNISNAHDVLQFIGREV